MKFYTNFVLKILDLKISQKFPNSVFAFITSCRIELKSVSRKKVCAWSKWIFPLLKKIRTPLHAEYSTAHGSVLNSRALASSTQQNVHVHMKICDNYGLHIWSCLLPSKPCKILRWMFPLNVQRAECKGKQQRHRHTCTRIDRQTDRVENSALATFQMKEKNRNKRNEQQQHELEQYRAECA